MDLGNAVRSADRSRVVGWRAWTVVETKAGVRLASVIYDTVWSASGPVTAECECGQAHVAPAPACTCGFYAARDPVDALTYLRRRGRDGGRLSGCDRPSTSSLRGRCGRRRGARSGVSSAHTLPGMRVRFC